jgi:hypothetical protein
VLADVLKTKKFDNSRLVFAVDPSDLTHRLFSSKLSMFVGTLVESGAVAP